MKVRFEYVDKHCFERDNSNFTIKIFKTYNNNGAERIKKSWIFNVISYIDFCYTIAKSGVPQLSIQL